jgi:hypothetical protein
MKANRDGAQSGLAQYAESKTTPSRASASMRGVLETVLPYERNAEGVI